MKFTKVFVLVGVVVLAFALSPVAAHAQYVGGNPPTAGPSSGPPSGPAGPSVLGQTFTNSGGTHHTSSSSSFSWADVAGIAAALAALGLIFLFFLWKRRRDEEEEDAGLGGAAPA